MTPTERAKPELIKASRKRRIAMGAGVQVQEVNRLLNQFEQTQKDDEAVLQGRHGKLMRGMKGHDAGHGALISASLGRLGWAGVVAPLVLPGGADHVRVFRLAQAAVVAAKGAVKVALLDIQIVAQDGAAVAQVGAQVEEVVVRRPIA
jgi:hypothetical protein